MYSCSIDPHQGYIWVCGYDRGRSVPHSYQHRPLSLSPVSKCHFKRRLFNEHCIVKLMQISLSWGILDEKITETCQVVALVEVMGPITGTTQFTTGMKWAGQFDKPKWITLSKGTMISCTVGSTSTFYMKNNVLLPSVRINQYTSECMVSIHDINDGIKGPTWPVSNCNTIQILILGGFHKMRDSLYTQVK